MVNDEPQIINRYKDMLAVYKPAGFLAHSVGDDVPDIVTWLKTVHDIEVKPVHRLDKPVSGLLLTALREPQTKTALDWELTQKSYLAIVHGLTRKKGIIKRSIKDGRRGRALDAETRYKTLAHSESVSLVSIKLVTGRKHQIRRHFEGLGHGVIGDRRYGRRARAWQGDYEGIWLHAHKLTLPDGTSFTAPLGPAWVKVCQELGFPNSFGPLAIQQSADR
jgi:23S rRNA-/tRNA-specific pseudouridylate synthase